MLLEEPVVEIDERAAHAPALPEGVLEHHLDHATQKRLAVQNLNKISFMVSPDGKRAVSAEEIKSDAHREIIEQSLKALLGERIDNAPYLPQPENGTGASAGFVEIHAPAHIQMLAEAGIKDFVKAHEVEQGSHAAKLRLNSAETAPARA